MPGGGSNPPEPLAAEARDGEDPPVDEDAELGLVVPVRQRPGVDRLPVGFVLGSDQQNRYQETNGQPTHVTEQSHRLD